MPQLEHITAIQTRLTLVFDEWLNLERQNIQLALARDILLPPLMSGAIPT